MDEDTTHAVLIANIPKEEKSILGIMSTTQLAIVGAGVIIGAVAFFVFKFILQLFGVPTVTKLVLSFILWGIIIAPFAYDAFHQVKSDGINPVPLYPQYVQRQIDKRSSLEYGTYVNYHVNHHVLTKGKAVHINNEGTQRPE